MLFQRTRVTSNEVDQLIAELEAEVARCLSEAELLLRHIARFSNELAASQRALKVIATALDSVDAVTRWTNRIPGVGRLISRVIDLVFDLLQRATQALSRVLGRVPAVIPRAIAKVSEFIANHVPTVDLRFGPIATLLDEMYALAKVLEPQQDLIEEVLPDAYEARAHGYLDEIDGYRGKLRIVLLRLRASNDSVRDVNGVLAQLTTDFFQLNVSMQPFVDAAMYVGTAVTELVRLFESVLTPIERAILEAADEFMDWVVDGVIAIVRGALSLLGVDLDAAMARLDAAADRLAAHIADVLKVTEAIDAILNLVESTIAPYEAELVTIAQDLVARLVLVEKKLNALRSMLSGIATWKDGVELITRANLTEFLRIVDELMEALDIPFDPEAVDPDRLFPKTLSDKERLELGAGVERARQLVADTRDAVFGRPIAPARIQRLAALDRMLTLTDGTCKWLARKLGKKGKVTLSRKEMLRLAGEIGESRRAAQDLVTELREESARLAPRLPRGYGKELTRTVAAVGSGPGEEALPDPSAPLIVLDHGRRVFTLADEHPLSGPLRSAYAAAGVLERTPLAEVPFEVGKKAPRRVLPPARRQRPPGLSTSGRGRPKNQR